MDLKNFDEVIGFAIEREIEAYEFYDKAREMAFGSAAKQMFAEFAAEERHHREILEKVKTEGVKDYQIKSVPNLKIAEYLIDIPFKPDMPIADIVHLALKREEKSYKLYMELATQVDDAGLKKTFSILATEELKHKNKFETMYDEQVLSEN